MEALFMFMKTLREINKLSLLFIGLTLVLAILLFYSFQTIFTSITGASGTGTTPVNDDLKVDKVKLDQAYKFVFENRRIEIQFQ